MRLPERLSPARDVVDIEARAVVDGYGPVGNSFYHSLTPNSSPNNTLGDGAKRMASRS